MSLRVSPVGGGFSLSSKVPLRSCHLRINICFGSKGEIPVPLAHFRFTPQSRHRLFMSTRPKCLVPAFAGAD